MPQWLPINASSLIPKQMATLLKALGKAGADVLLVAKDLGAAIAKIRKYLGGPTNFARQALRAAIAEIRAIWGDIMAIGLYVYYDTTGFPMYKTKGFDPAALKKAILAGNSQAAGANSPVSPNLQFGVGGWISRWGASFSDQGDLNRPMFSNEAAMYCLVFLAGMPLLDLGPFLALLGDLFDIGAFKHLMDFLKTTTLAEEASPGDLFVTLADSSGFQENYFFLIGDNPLTMEFVVSKAIDRSDDTVTIYNPVLATWPVGTPVMMCGSDPHTTAASVAPDWLGGNDLNALFNYAVVGKGQGSPPMKLGDLGPMRKMDRLVKRFLTMLDLGAEFLDALSKLIALIDQKITQLQKLLLEIDNLIKLIEEILSVSGVYVIYLHSQHGPQGLIDAMAAAGNPPLPQESYVIGVCLASGTPDFGTVAEMFGAAA